jgi:methylthioribose-1-phosphate isomerase
MNDQRVRTIWWEEGGAATADASLCILDQTLLPQSIVYAHLVHEQQVAEAIMQLKVRGAPLIGVTAAFGMALAVRRLWQAAETQQKTLSLDELMAHVEQAYQLLHATRPTAVNLFWALDRMQRCARRVSAQGLSVRQVVSALQVEAQMIADEDAQSCLQMGRYGADLIADGDTLLTHCNAGALATNGIGTALAPIYAAIARGKQLHVFVDETRPILQGARLTAWELQQGNVPLTLITDSMAGHFMRQGRIQAIFVGADRIALNGDVANKIGTYSLSVLAHAHHLPVYVVAPCSTIDLTLSTGEHIPIEQRKPEEVTTFAGLVTAPDGVNVANPAFDITPNPYITAIITEKGIARPPYGETLTALCLGNSTSWEGV